MQHKKRAVLTAIALASLIAGLALFMLQFLHSENGLVNAIRTNDAARVKALLQSGADPNHRDTPHHVPTLVLFFERLLHGERNDSSQANLGTTPLLAALYHSQYKTGHGLEFQYNPDPNLEIIRALLDRGADINAVDDVQTPPIIFAVASGNIAVVDLLVRHGASAVTKDQAGNPLLLEAACQGRVEMMRYLLAHGADIKSRDAWQETALISTVRYARSPEAVRFLIEKHVDVNAADTNGKTALFFAQNPDSYLAPSQTQRLPEVIALLQKAHAK